MSLINDALKRTKEAQQHNPPPSGGPELRPADSAAAKSASGAKSLLFILVACVIMGNALLFVALSDRGAKPEAAPVAPAPAAPIQAVTTAAPSAPQTAAGVTGTAPTQPSPAPATPVSAAPDAPALAVADTNAVVAPAVAETEPPKPAPLKLQSIVYNPGRSSAMISGKFVFVGDRVRGLSVVAIDKEEVTLVGDGQTNVLSLP
jgi:hypothetical protein